MYIKVRVKAGAKEETFEKADDNLFKISVKEKAEGGKANRRVLELLKMHFKHHIVSIVHGHHSPSKIANVEEK